MKYIKLTKGYSTKVDDEDFEKFNKYKWQVIIDNKDNNYIRAKRGIYISNKKRKTIYLSREILNTSKEFYVDHINRDPLDNRKCNLRICTNAENGANRKINKNNTSGFRGISWNKKMNKWRVLIKFTVDKKIKHEFGGYFEDKIKAAKIFDKLAIKHEGNFAKLNFPI